MGITEFQAVVMAAGRGSRMTEISKGCPKCLLPLGNVPLVWYPLTMLRKNGFKEAIVVILEESTKKEVSDLQSKVDLKLDIVPISSAEDWEEDWGTADSLRYLKQKGKIRGDVVIISCDLITDYPLHYLADVHRSHDASLTILLSAVSQELKEGSTPGHKGKHRQERDIIGLEIGSDRLMLLNSEADFEEGVPFRTSVLKNHPNFKIFSNLNDAHIYIMKQTIVDFLVANDSISTIKGELLPVLISKQFSSKKRKPVKDDGLLESHGEAKLDYEQLIQDLSTKPTKVNNYTIECYGHVLREGLCLRVNTIATYVEINRQIIKYLPLFQNGSQKINTPTTPKSQVGSDCLIEESTSISEKVRTVKHSNIGRDCILGDNVRVINCVLMDKVIIEEGSTIQGCIVCNGVHIGKQCDLKDCIVGEGQQVGDFGKHTNDVIQEADELMEI